MKSSLRILLLLLLAACAGAQDYQLALPGYSYRFPRDNFDHPAYQTEWWYYTGNLRAADGHRFGFELTFFRQTVARDANASTWHIHDLYMAHLALSDLSGHRFYSMERVNRAGPGIAGIDEKTGTIWNGNWQAVLHPDSQTLRGMAGDFSFQFTVQPLKPPVINGIDGISQKAEGVGHASHYISLTRLLTHGSIELKGKSYSVEGSAWMDHEFFSDSMSSIESGWDWLSVQLDDNTELMLYRLRRRDGSIDPYSSATYIDAHGKALHLSLQDFSMTPSGSTWTSHATGGTYPVSWQVAVPQLGLHLAITTPLKSQELIGRVGPSYWEGAIDIAGERDGRHLHGAGYLEMTGYARLNPWQLPRQALR
ncbi:MAG TPA: lipocalin-like domain-containing protein [Terracidiphilus sp.]|jgi:predicted secreted hydrolase|nr:lipocalin-like domain-containing protein [Terracidiphilus sp.]